MKQLLSVGIDVGTTTTQLIFSRLQVENTAGSFAVPELKITKKEPFYRSAIHFTPLLDSDTIDADGVREIVRAEYESAGIARSQVQTGAVIITGETSRKRNAEAVTRALAEFAGSFVVAAAGPALESVLSARGAGAPEASEASQLPVLHLDIGGGTTNLSLWREGSLVSTGCYNIGGRLIRLSPAGRIEWISPVLTGRTSLSVGQAVTPDDLREVVDLLVTALEEAVGLRPAMEHARSLVTDQALPVPDEPLCLSFSGGVADLIFAESLPDWLQFGDIGVLLADAIRGSRLLQGTYRRGSETIRATVLGAGTHSVELSGSTVYLDRVTLPMQNLPVLRADAQNIASLAQALARYPGETPAIALPGIVSPTFSQVSALSDQLAAVLRDQPAAVIVTETDMAKALGFALRSRLPGKPLICLDALTLPHDAYLDIGEPVESAVPVIIKTLIFSS